MTMVHSERVALHTLGTDRPSVLAVPPADLAAWCVGHGGRPYHARQIRRWILAARATSFDLMTDLPKTLRQALGQHYAVFSTTTATHRVAKDGTHKLVLRLSDGQLIECVLIQDEDRRTACISTQVGCGMGCVFCASGLNGVSRNLEPHEITEQLVQLRNRLPDQERLTNIVVMGMGEPLANLDNLMVALEEAGAREGLGIGARHIIISTVGLPARIRRLADLGKQYHLAVSLHAPTDALRTRIVPTNNRTGLSEILAASDYFFAKTGRQVTFEYVLLGGINDGLPQARELARLLRKRKAYVNLIPFNEVPGLPYRRPTDAALASFVEHLRTSGISVKVRKRKGSEIDAACGQLRRTVEAQQGPVETFLPHGGSTG